MPDTDRIRFAGCLAKTRPGLRLLLAIHGSRLAWEKIREIEGSDERRTSHAAE